MDIEIPDHIFETYKNNPIMPYLEKAVKIGNIEKVARYTISLANSIEGIVSKFLKRGEIYSKRNGGLLTDTHYSEHTSPYVLEDALILYKVAKSAAEIARYDKSDKIKRTAYSVINEASNRVKELTPRLEAAGIIEPRKPTDTIEQKLSTLYNDGRVTLP